MSRVRAVLGAIAAAANVVLAVGLPLRSHRVAGRELGQRWVAIHASGDAGGLPALLILPESSSFDAAAGVLRVGGSEGLVGHPTRVSGGQAADVRALDLVTAPSTDCDTSEAWVVGTIVD